MSAPVAMARPTVVLRPVTAAPVPELMAVVTHPEIAAWWGGCDDPDHRLVVDPAVHDERAVRRCTRVGFRPVGVQRRYAHAADGTWHDSLLMDLLAEDLR